MCLKSSNLKNNLWNCLPKHFKDSKPCQIGKSTVQKIGGTLRKNFHYLNMYSLKMSSNYKKQEPFHYNNELCQNVNFSRKNGRKINFPFSGN